MKNTEIDCELIKSHLKHVESMFELIRESIERIENRTRGDQEK
jgi:hypothetical protein